MLDTWLLAPGFRLLGTGPKILERKRGRGNLGADNRKIATAGQEKETNSKKPAARLSL